jgi:hypothetical protein
MSYSAAYQEACASAPPTAVVLETLEIYHPTWGSPVRLVCDRDSLTATLESTAPNDPSTAVTFAPFPFTVTRPKKGEGGQELSIVVDNATLLLMGLIESLDLSVDNPVRVIYRPYLLSDLSAPAINPPLILQCRTIKATLAALTLTCSYADFANLRFPRQVYRITPGNASYPYFPGLDSRVGSS